jgi:SAM-dependent methyltransferase
MHEILPHLPRESRVLDLGSRFGSFDRDAYPFTTIRLDIEGAPGGASRNVVQADAARLPFRDGAFHAVIANHSLEHFDDLDACLREIGRVISPQAALYVAVPDAGTFSDRLYRWLGRGGGHVNPFTSAMELGRRITQATGLSHRGTRVLCTSFSFLNSKNWVAPPPKRIFLVGGGSELGLVVWNYLFRLWDHVLGTRLAVYGWALYFGSIPGTIDPQPWINVCVRCGSGHQAASLIGERRVARKFGLFRTYGCPQCGAMNLFWGRSSGYGMG